MDSDKQPPVFWFTPPFAKWVSGGQVTESRLLMLLTLVFWASTYSIFSVRTVLFPPVGIDVISAKRLITTFFGALLFLLAVARLRYPSESGADRHKLLIVSSTLAASAVLLLLRVVYNRLAEPYAFDLADHGRWILVWCGYFLAGLALFSPGERRAPVTTQAAADPDGPLQTPQVIWVQGNKRSIGLPVSEIEWMEAQGNYVYAHADEAGGMLRSSLSSLEERLAPHGFIRVHRSALCQKGHMLGLKRTSGGRLAIIMNSGQEVPVGRRYAADVTELMSNRTPH